ncbi:MAG: FAD/NAD(P)-binding protein [Armatimonadota bacterium]
MSIHSAPMKDAYLPEVATILHTEMMTANDQYIEIQLPNAKDLGHMPGQFVQLSVVGVGEAPLSVSSSPDLHGSFEVVVRNAGRVTDALHRLATGATLGFRGPFGTHFPVDEGMKGKDVLFICGGIGLVPLRSAIQYVLNRRGDYGEVNILLGTRSPAERLFTDELAAWTETEGVTFLETVDRADEQWTGNMGLITTLIPQIKVVPSNTCVIICGPPVMYKFVIRELTARGMTFNDIYVSLERRMKCGVGKCGHCQINGLYTCMDGPVFNYADVADAPEAI